MLGLCGLEMGMLRFIAAYDLRIDFVSFMLLHALFTMRLNRPSLLLLRVTTMCHFEVAQSV